MSPGMGRFLLAVVLITFLWDMVCCGPARDQFEGDYSENGYHDVFDDGHYVRSEEETNSGVLDRLWSGFTNLNPFGSGEFEGKMQRFRRDVMNRLKRSVSDIEEGRIRQKRAHPIETILTRDTKGYYRLFQLDNQVNTQLRNFPSPQDATSMEVFEHLNFVFWIVTEDYTSDNPGYLNVYMLDVVRNTLQQARAESLGAKKCLPVLKLDTFVEIVCVETQGHEMTSTRKGAGSGVFRITWASGLSVDFQRALKTHGAQDVAIWKFGSFSYLAFANSFDVDKGSGEIRSVVFKLQTTTLSGVVYTAYDNIERASFGTKYAYGLESFKIVSRQFLAVANHRDDLGNVEIDSVIYIYDLLNDQLRPFQRIPTSAARDWVSFDFTQGPSTEHFLAVANEYKIDKNGNKDYEIDSVIYKYDTGKYGEGKFVPFQCIRTNGARQWIVYQGPKGEFLLGVVNGQSGVAFYQYNGWRFVQSPFKISEAGATFASFSYLPNTLNQLVLTVANPNEPISRPLAYYVTFQYTNPLGEYHNDALAWCKSLSNSVSNDGLSSLVRRVQDASKVTDSRNFTTAVTIRGNLIVTADFASVLNIIILSQGLSVDIGFEALEDLRREIDEALRQLAVVRNLLEDARKLHSITDMDGVRFSNVRIVCSNGNVIGKCSVNSLIANVVNGIHARFDDVIRIDQARNFQSLIIPDLSVTNKGQLSIEYLSGPGFPSTSFSNIVTLNGNHDILGTKTFRKIQANFLVVSGLVAGVRISRDNLLLTVGEQRITSQVTVESLRGNRVTVGSINGRDFNSFFDNLVLNGGNQAFTGTLIINGDLLAPSISTINPVTPLDPVTARDRVLLHNTGETQYITGSHQVRELIARQGITVNGKLNGVSIPDDLYLTNSNEVINRPVTFNDVVADMVTVDGMLGNVQVRNGELDLLLLNGDQIVTGKKSFNEITLRGHSSVDGTVAGYKLQDLTSDLSSEFIRGLLAGNGITGSVSFEGDLTVLDDNVDGVSISRILNNAIPLSANRISNQLIFDGPVQVDGDLRITNSLNGVNIADYVLKDGTHTFTGEITFTSNLVNQGNVDVTTVNGYDISSLASGVFLLNGAQTITGDITLNNPEFRDLSVSGDVLVNGVNLNDVVTLNSNAVITGVKTFTIVNVQSSVKAGAVNVGQFGTVDGVVISDLFFGDSLRKTGTSVQNLVGRSLNVVVAESARGTNLADLAKRVVYKDRPETIDGSLTFNGPVTIIDLSFNGNFDGVSAEDYNSGWLLKTGVQTLSGRNYFKDFNTGDVTFTGNFIQGTDLTLLNRNTAKIDEATTLGKVSFEEVLSMSPIVLDGKIQGFKLREDALLSNGIKQVVTGKKIFLDTIHFTGEFNINGTVKVQNNPTDDPVSLDVGGLCQQTGPGTSNFQEVVIDGNAIFNGNVNITQSLNNIDVFNLARDYWLTNAPFYIQSETYFSNLEVAPPASLLLDGDINDLNINSLYEQILKKECETQTVIGAYYIDELTVDRLETDSVTNSKDNLGLNGLSNILLRDGDQDITGLLKLNKLETRDSVILDGTINGLNVDTDFAQYDQSATITAVKTFQSLTIRGDLSLQDRSTVQGVDISELAKNAVKPSVDGSGNCFIPGTTTFSGLRFADGSLEVGGTVDGIQLNKDSILLKSTDQDVIGRITLNGKTSLETTSNFTILNDKFNDISLSRLRDFTVRNNRANVIEAEVTFATSPTFTSITISNHLLNGYNITDLGLCLTGKHIVNNMGDQFTAILRAANDAKAMLSEKATELWYFKESPYELFDKLLPVSVKTGVLTPLMFDSFAALNFDQGLIRVYKIDSGFPVVGQPIRVDQPMSAVGMTRDMLATCGKVGMPATPGSFIQIPLETGLTTGYGHIYQLRSGNSAQVKIAFGIYDCRDLVSFKLPDGRLCLAVIDNYASSTVLCGYHDTGFKLLNYLGTTTAVKGAWMQLDNKPYLLVVEHELMSRPGYLKVFSYQEFEDMMVLVSKIELHGGDDVDVIIQGTGAVIAVSSRENVLTTSSVTILTAFHENGNLLLQTLQTITTPGVHHSSLSETPSGEVALFVQTATAIRLYLWKCTEFVYTREIRTKQALWPSSEAFLHGSDGEKYLTVAYGASGILDTQTNEQIQDLLETKIFTAIYRGSYAKMPNYLL